MRDGLLLIIAVLAASTAEGATIQEHEISMYGHAEGTTTHYALRSDGSVIMNANVWNQETFVFPAPVELGNIWGNQSPPGPIAFYEVAKDRDGAGYAGHFVLLANGDAYARWNDQNATVFKGSGPFYLGNFWQGGINPLSEIVSYSAQFIDYELVDHVLTLANGQVWRRPSHINQIGGPNIFMALPYMLGYLDNQPVAAQPATLGTIKMQYQSKAAKR